MSKPRFFKTPADLRKWFAKHAATKDELHVGYYKKHTGHPSITWPESVDEALCVGWIDGIRHRIDEESYRIRFTPRRVNSHWSAVNLKRVEVLTAEGRMQPAGLAAFEKRQTKNSKQAAYEQQVSPKLSKEHLAKLKEHPEAEAFFKALPPGYRKTCIWRINSAKRQETRDRRFSNLLESFLKQQRPH